MCIESELMLERCEVYICECNDPANEASEFKLGINEA